jgi:hypothetical protein
VYHVSPPETILTLSLKKGAMDISPIPHQPEAKKVESATATADKKHSEALRRISESPLRQLFEPQNKKVA